MADDKFTAEQVIAAIKKSGGIKTVIALRLGCHRHTVDNYIKKFPEVAQAYHDENESYIDYVESKAMHLISRNNERMITFFLETKAKQRGWVRRRELTGADGKPMAGLVGQVDFMEVLQDKELRDAMKLLADKFTPELVEDLPDENEENSNEDS